MNRTIHTIETELKALDRDRTMSTSLWMEVYVKLQHELRAAHKANDFDYDAAIEGTRQDDLSYDDAWQIETDAEVSTRDFEHLWSMSLHPWAWRGIALWFGVFHVVGLVALWAR